MGFFQTIKNKLGVGGVSVALVTPGQVAKSDGIITGKVILTTKSEQELVKLSVKLIEEFTTGRGDDKKTKEFELGRFSLNLNNAAIKPGDEAEHPFSFPFELLRSNNEDLAGRGGALGALGKLGSFANNEKSEYFLVAEADVKSTALDPSDKKPVKLV